MAKKKKRTEKLPRELTKRQLSHWQQQKKRQRIILMTGISIIAAVFMIVVVGWYVSNFRPMHQTVIKVNDAKFNMKYYIDTLRILGQGADVQTLADSVVNVIEQNELIKQEALKLGISASKDEVREELESSKLPINDATTDLISSQILIEKLKDQYFDSQVPTSTEQVHMMAMLLESESQATDIRARLESGDNFTALAGEFSLNSFTKTSKGDLRWHSESILTQLLGTSVPGEYAFGVEAGMLSQPRYDAEISKAVGYWLIRVTDREEDQANVEAMLLGSEEEAQKTKARLEAGEDFATLAKELSQLTGAAENGGVLGPVTEGELTTAFDDFVFNPDTKPGTLSEPIRDETVATKGGYWLIKVLDKDSNRQIDKDDRDSLMAQALNEWAVSLLIDPGNEVENYLNATNKAWAIEQALSG